MTRFGLAAMLVAVLALLGFAAGAAAQPRLALDPALVQRLAQSGPDEMIEVVVVLKRQAALPTLPRSRRRDRHAAVIHALRATADAAQAPLRALLARRRLEGRVIRIRPLWIFDGLAVTATPDVVRELAAHPAVREVRASREIFAPATSSAAGANPAEPNLDVVDAPALWNLGDRGQGVVVASLDTGVDVTHPDLAASWRGGKNSWYDPNGEHPTTPTDVSGHGTWTMGVMVGGDAGGTGIGVAPAAKWIAVKMFNDRGTSTSAVVHQGFQWLLDPDGDPSTADAPDVVNNSWSMAGAGCNLEFQLDLRALRAAGILPVFAAGNTGPAFGTSLSPANNPEALAVGGTNLTDGIDPGSSRGPSACDGGIYPELVAPGVGIRTADLFASYTTQTGTSMAAPHVSGALALLLSAFPDLPADRQETALVNGARDLLDPGPDNSTGYGRLDVLASYDWLRTAPDFTLAASPASATTAPGGSVSYAVDVGSLNGFTGDVALSVSGVSGTQASWTFTPVTVAGGAGPAELRVTTAGSLAPGSYPLTITGTSGSLVHRATVTLEVPAPPDFTLSAAPASATTLAGGSITYTVTVGSQSGFAGDVALSLTGLGSTQAGWTFAPATVTGGSGSSTLTVATASTLPPGTYPLTLTGQSGSVTHTAAVNLVVAPPPDFSVAASPPSTTTSPGGPASYTVSVGALNGFTGAVALTLSGLTSSQATWSFSPASVSAPGTSTLRITTTTSIAPGTYSLSITGTSAGRTHSASVRLTVSPPPDFALTITPASQTVSRGSSTVFTVAVAAKNGFAGSVSLSASGLPSSATASFSVNPVAAGGSSTLTVRTGPLTPRGTFTVKVVGSAGTLTRQATATLVVR